MLMNPAIVHSMTMEVALGFTFMHVVTTATTMIKAVISLPTREVVVVVIIVQPVGKIQMQVEANQPTISIVLVVHSKPTAKASVIPE